MRSVIKTLSRRRSLRPTGLAFSWSSWHPTRRSTSRLSAQWRCAGMFNCHRMNWNAEHWSGRSFTTAALAGRHASLSISWMESWDRSGDRE